MRAVALIALSLMSAPVLAAEAKEGIKSLSEDTIGSQLASVDEIVGAVGDCFKFVKHHGQVDHDGLKAAGWQFASKKDVPASAAMPANTEVILGRGNVIMILRLSGLAATCQTVARIEDRARVGEVRAGIAQTMKASPAIEYKGDDAFKATIGRSDPAILANMLISDSARFTVADLSNADTSVVSTIMVPRILD